MNKMNKTVVAIAAIAGLGLSSQAMSGAVGFAYLEVDNIRLYNDTTGVQLDASAFSFLDIGNTSTSSATSSFGPGVSNSNPFGHDSALACSGNCGGIASNDFTQNVGINNFGRGDSNGNGGNLLTGVPGAGGLPTFANVQTVAEGRQDVTGFTTGNSGALSTTEFTFTLGADTTARLDFDAFGELFAELHQDEFLAQAANNWGINIVNIGTGTTVFQWNPDGAAGGITGGTEISDAFSLNTARSVVNAGSSGTGAQSGFFSASATLLGGVDYRFTIDHNSAITTNAAKAVPEPGMLALLAVGIGAFGFSRRAKKA